MAPVGECLPSMRKPWVPSLTLHRCEGTHLWSWLLVVEAGASDIQGHPWIHSGCEPDWETDPVWENQCHVQSQDALRFP